MRARAWKVVVQPCSVYMYTCIHVCIHTHAYIYIYIYIHRYKYISIYIISLKCVPTRGKWWCSPVRPCG